MQLIKLLNSVGKSVIIVKEDTCNWDTSDAQADLNESQKIRSIDVSFIVKDSTPCQKKDTKH